MNTDFMILDQDIRDKRFKKNINSSNGLSRNRNQNGNGEFIMRGDSKYYTDGKCADMPEFAREQNTVFDPITSDILYGINTNMHVLGVSDGTCNQINPLIYSPQYICGTGTAGGNRCRKDAYGIETFDSDSNSCDSCNVTVFIIIIILSIIFICVLYAKYKNEDILLSK